MAQPKEDPFVTTLIRIPESLAERVHEAAKEAGVWHTLYVRWALEHYLTCETKPDPRRDRAG